MFNDFTKIICITDRKICAAPFLQQIEKICRLKPRAVILREKDLTAEEYLALLRQVQPVCEKHGVKLIAHTHWQAVFTPSISTVHLPLPVLRNLSTVERGLFACIGTSVHSIEETGEAIRLGAGYVM